MGHGFIRSALGSILAPCYIFLLYTADIGTIVQFFWVSTHQFAEDIRTLFIVQSLLLSKWLIVC